MEQIIDFGESGSGDTKSGDTGSGETGTGDAGLADTGSDLTTFLNTIVPPPFPLDDTIQNDGNAGSGEAGSDDTGSELTDFLNTIVRPPFPSVDTLQNDGDAESGQLGPELTSFLNSIGPPFFPLDDTTQNDGEAESELTSFSDDFLDEIFPPSNDTTQNDGQTNFLNPIVSRLDTSDDTTQNEGELQVSNTSHPNGRKGSTFSRNFSLKLVSDTYEMCADRYKEHLKETYPTFTEQEKAFICAMKVGFDPYDIVDRNILSLPPHISFSPHMLENNLNNDILRCFAFERWQGCPEYIYETLKPALRLASWFITHRSCSALWHTLLRNRREVEWVNVRTRIYIVDRQKGPRSRIHQLENWDAEREKVLFQIIDVIRTQIQFTNLSSLVADEAYGYSYQVQQGNDVLHMIAIHGDYMTVAKRLAATQHKDPMMVLRYNLLLASTLTHEFAHCLEYITRQVLYPGSRDETYLLDHTWAEVGDAWEAITFGGSLEPMGNRIDAAHGLYIAPYGSELMSEPAVAIPMDLIYGYQRREFYPDSPWQDLGWKWLQVVDKANPAPRAEAYAWVDVRSWDWKEKPVYFPVKETVVEPEEESPYPGYAPARQNRSI